MAQFFTGPKAAVVPTPPVSPFDDTALSVLSAAGHIHEASDHELNGVTYLSDAAAGVGSNDEVSWTGTGFAAADKTPRVQLALASGFGFTAYRRDQMGMVNYPSLDAHLEASERRFDIWESFDVEKHMAAYFVANGTKVGASALAPRAALAQLFQEYAKLNQSKPLVHMDRGTSVILLEQDTVEQAGGTGIPGSGYGVGLATGTGRIWLTGAVDLYRAEIIRTVVPTPARNTVDTLNEVGYYAVVDGPILYADVTLA